MNKKKFYFQFKYFFFSFSFIFRILRYQKLKYFFKIKLFNRIGRYNSNLKNDENTIDVL